MKLLVNDRRIELPDGASFETLFEAVGAQPDRVAVMVNGEVVPRTEQAAFELKDGDRIELLTFAGGG